MSKPRKQVKHEFTVAMDGKTYQCERVVLGTRVLTQRIHVIGIGMEEDSASYGQRDRPVVGMAGVAKIIATNIIARAGKSQAP
jgi:hypothetical protein